MTMTLEQVRDELRRPWNQTSAYAWCAQLADAIDAHLSQPQPVAQGEAVAWMAPGGNIVTDAEKKAMISRSFAAMYSTPLYTKSTIPTGHRVVPANVAIYETINARIEHFERIGKAGGQYIDGRRHEARLILDLLNNNTVAAAPDAGGV